MPRILRHNGHQCPFSLFALRRVFDQAQHKFFLSGLPEVHAGKRESEHE